MKNDISKEVISEKIVHLKELERRVNEIFEEIKFKEVLLENDWISDTSDLSYIAFNKMFKKFENIKEEIRGYIVSFEHIVNGPNNSGIVSDTVSKDSNN